MSLQETIYEDLLKKVEKAKASGSTKKEGYLLSARHSQRFILAYPEELQNLTRGLSRSFRESPEIMGWVAAGGEGLTLILRSEKRGAENREIHLIDKQREAASRPTL